MSPRLPGRASPILYSSPTTASAESISLPAQVSRIQQNRLIQKSANLRPLTLPSLPRFHPANFSSQGSSPSSTPMSGPNSPQSPLSPRIQHKNYSEAQKQLYTYQRELLSNINRTKKIVSKKPVSPRLIPVGSPGPITPLELEGEDEVDYLTARSTSYSCVSGMTRSLLADELAIEEGTALHEMSPPPKSPRPTSAA